MSAAISGVSPVRTCHLPWVEVTAAGTQAWHPLARRGSGPVGRGGAGGPGNVPEQLWARRQSPCWGVGGGVGGDGSWPEDRQSLPPASPHPVPSAGFFLAAWLSYGCFLATALICLPHLPSFTSCWTFSVQSGLCYQPCIFSDWPDSFSPPALLSRERVIPHVACLPVESESWRPLLPAAVSPALLGSVHWALGSPSWLCVCSALLVVWPRHGALLPPECRHVPVHTRPQAPEGFWGVRLLLPC